MTTVCRDCGATITLDGDVWRDRKGDGQCPAGIGTHTPEG